MSEIFGMFAELGYGNIENLRTHLNRYPHHINATNQVIIQYIINFNDNSSTTILFLSLKS